MTFVCYNPRQKSLGQYCFIHIILSFLGSLLKQCILLEIFMQFSLPPPYTKLKLGKKFWIHLSNIVCGVRGGVGPEWSGKCPRNAKVCQDFCPWLYVCTLRICHTVVVNIFKNCNFNTKSVVYFLYYGCVPVSFLSRGNGAFWNIGGLIFHSAMPVPLQLHFPKVLGVLSWHKQTSFQSSQCLVCQWSLCDNASVGSCSSLFRQSSCFMVLLG